MMKIIFAAFTVFALSSTCFSALFAQNDQSQGVQLFARIGNGIVINESMDAIGFGLGLEHQMSSRWVFRAELGYEWDQYNTSLLERDILRLADSDAFTRSISAAISAIHYWPIDAASRHQIGPGVGISGRIFQWQGVTEYFVVNRFDREQRIEDLIVATVDKNEENIASLLIGLYYKFRLTNKAELGTFCRYDLTAYQAQETPLKTEFRVNEEGQVIGLSNTFQSFVDGPRAVTLGFQFFYSF